MNPIPGLTVPASGIGSLTISGMPTAVGAETFTVTATDSASEETSTNYTITVNPIGTPTITVSTSSLNLGTATAGTAGTAQAYTVSGSSLTAEIVLTAPSGVELSDNGGNSYSTTLDLAESGGTVASTTIDARISATAATGPVSGSITNTSTGATEQGVSVSGTVNAVGTPTITVSTNSLNLGTTTAGTAGTAQTYTVSGSNLTAEIVLTAPSGVELSDNGGNSYSTTLDLAESGGMVASTTIDARIAATAATSPVSGSITDTSTGASTQDISVSGTVTSPSSISTTTVLTTDNPSGSVYGQTVTFTATVTPGSGSFDNGGTVQFAVDATDVGAPATLSGGVATFSDSALAVGAHTIAAAYSGDTSFGPSDGTLSGSQTVARADTTTTLTSSVNPSTLFQTVLFTVAVTAVAPGAGTPTGTVDFFDETDDLDLGSRTLSGGTATQNESALPLGTHVIVARYSGDGNFQATGADAGSTAVPLTQTVNLTLTVTDAGGTYNGSAFPATWTLNGVTNGSLEGVTPTLTYYVGTGTGGTDLGSTAPSSAGTYTVVATFAGSTDFGMVQSTPGTFMIAKATPTLTVTDAGGTYNGTAFPATWTLNGVTNGSLEDVTPTLTYYVGMGTGGTDLGSTAPSSAGTYTVVAKFAGSPDYGAAQSLPDTFPIGAVGSPSVSVTTPSSPQSGNVTISYSLTDSASDKCSITAQYSTDLGATWSPATVIGGDGLTGLASSPTGTPHRLIWDSAVDASAPNDSQVEFRITPTDLVTKAVGAAATTEVFAINITTTTITASLNPATLGATVTLTATVSAVIPGSGTPTGLVQFEDFTHGLLILGTAPLDSDGTATFSTSHLPLGARSLFAFYEGNANFQISGGDLYEQINRPVATTTTLTASANPAGLGQMVTFTATVTSKPGTLAGTVVFKDGKTTMGTGTPIGGGKFTFSTSTLSLGTYAITASYSGDSVHGPSTSAKLTEAVKQAATVSLASSSNPAPAGQMVTFTATVGGGSGPPTGSVTFKDGGKVLKTVTLSKGGTASYSTTKLAVGSHTITATYPGDKTLAPASSASLIQTVSGTTATPSSTALAIAAVATAASPATAPSLGATSTSAIDAALRALLLDDSAVTSKPRALFES